jgi:hypothetical protein
MMLSRQLRRLVDVYRSKRLSLDTENRDTDTGREPTFAEFAVEVNNSSQQRLCLANGKHSCRDYSRSIR